MNFISREQCRAARGLLNWTQQDLAQQSQLSKTAINNFERGLSNVKNKTVNAIYQALTDQGILFLENDGLKRHKTEHICLIGANIMNQIIDDMINQYHESMAPIVICGESVFLKNRSFKTGLLRLKKQKMKYHIHDRVAINKNMVTLCYGYRVAYYYPLDKTCIIIENPHISRAERKRIHESIS